MNCKENIDQMIRRLNDEMIESLLSHDNLRMASYYHDDAVIIGANKFFAKGREEVNKFCLGQNNLTWEVTIDDIKAGDRFVSQIGRSKSTWDNGNNDIGCYECNFSYLWERQEDGSYKIILDCFN
jgi:ketosteroid isomerase-like protein